MNTRPPIIHILIAVILLGMLAGLFYVTEKTVVSVNMLELEVGRQIENVDKLGVLRTSLPGLAPQIESFLSTLPISEQNVADFASALEQEARAIGLVITFQFEDFPKQVDVSGQNLFGLGSEIALEGTFQGVTAFMSRLSALPYFFKIDKLTVLNHETAAGVKTIITGSLMMSTERQAI